MELVQYNISLKLMDNLLKNSKAWQMKKHAKNVRTEAEKANLKL